MLKLGTVILIPRVIALGGGALGFYHVMKVLFSRLKEIPESLPVHLHPLHCVRKQREALSVNLEVDYYQILSLLVP